MSRRIILDCIILILAFTTPWWVSFIIALLAVIVFDRYIEFIFLGVILDSLYNAPVTRFHQFQFLLTLVAGILLISINYVKTVLRLER